ncbi:hypothetical protein P3T24_006491 [Paraburkholderia sp. GAS33]|uniref:hypothetical protein n=1 Tax=Paraburkholderia sp. GAS33 TaxID=3035130 RepID=UPI003D1FB584
MLPPAKLNSEPNQPHRLSFSRRKATAGVVVKMGEAIVILRCHPTLHGARQVTTLMSVGGTTALESESDIHTHEA